MTFMNMSIVGDDFLHVYRGTPLSEDVDPGLDTWVASLSGRHDSLTVTVNVSWATLIFVTDANSTSTGFLARFDSRPSSNGGGHNLISRQIMLVTVFSCLGVVVIVGVGILVWKAGGRCSSSAPASLPRIAWSRLHGNPSQAPILLGSGAFCNVFEMLMDKVMPVAVKLSGADRYDEMAIRNECDVHAILLVRCGSQAKCH